MEPLQGARMNRFKIEPDDISQDEAVNQDIDPVGTIEGDIRALMKKLGEADFALGKQDKESQGKTKKLLLSLLDIMDSFERVFDAVHKKPDLVTKQMKKWIANFRTIHRMLRQVLSDQGVTRIENLDQGFDPQWHQVLETVNDPAQEEGAITEEVKAGYVWHGVILRKAEVMVVRHDTKTVEQESKPN